MGSALTVGGIAQLLAVSKASSSDQRNGALFQGNATAVYQGTSVGIVYGRALVSPMPVCVSQDSLSQNSYEGEILQVGKLGSPLDTEILYSYRGGMATLCGIDEYVPSDGSGVSAPPKRFLRETWSGEGGCSNQSYHYCTIDGARTIDAATCVETDATTINGAPPGYGFSDGDPWCLSHLSSLCWLVRTETRTRTVRTRTYVRDLECEYCGTIDLTWVRTLSEEDTELDAINRLLLASSWSPWQSMPVYPFYEQRVSGFSFYYREVRIKTITTEKYNPGINYKLSATYQRRTYGSSDPWVDAETIVTNQKPNNSGDFEIDVPNISGYETKLKTLTISL